MPQDAEGFLARSYKRGVLDRDDQHTYSVANFHTRYDIWALFEGWQDIPDDIKYLLNGWEIDFYQDQHRSMVEDLKQNRPRDTAERWPEYLLLQEAEALIDRAAHVYLWPCNCRAMMGECEKPVYTCLRFSNHRGLGWEISKHRAKEIMQAANRKGLMQSGEIAVELDGTVGGALCNCCADCCFPHLLAERLRAEKLWPLTRYQARVDLNACTACGRCVRRCPFEAISLETLSNDPDNAAVKIDHGLCRGCGVCSTGCREEAIFMVRLDGVDSLFDMLDL
jgi:ferredoxin